MRKTIEEILPDCITLNQVDRANIQEQVENYHIRNGHYPTGHDLLDIIGAMFNWSASPQGGEYWNNLLTREHRAQEKRSLEKIKNAIAASTAIMTCA